MKLKFMMSMIVSLFVMESQAVICQSASSSPQAIVLDLSSAITGTNNAVGKITEITRRVGTSAFAICPKHDDNPENITYRTYRLAAGKRIDRTIDEFQYIKLNDYLLGAMRITDHAAGWFYPPIHQLQMGKHPAVSQGEFFPVADSSFLFKIYVTKAFVGSISIPATPIMTVHVSTRPEDGLSPVVYTIAYTGAVSAPQDCIIGEGTSLTIDFNKIASNSFTRAGIGNKLPDVTAQQRVIPIQCKNIDASAFLTIRLTSNDHTGSILHSSNPDIGFQVATEVNSLLVPNDPKSIAPIFLNNSISTVSLNFWPVSLTGKTPSLGPFSSSTAYLRVDFP